jgi:hypothetical protein
MRERPRYVIKWSSPGRCSRKPWLLVGGEKFPKFITIRSQICIHIKILWKPEGAKNFQEPNQRDYRDGWLLLTVETQVKGHLMKGVLSWFVLWAYRAGTRDLCSALAALVGPVQNMFFITIHYYNFFVPFAQQARQAAMLGRLSISACLWPIPRKIWFPSANPGKHTVFTLLL